MAVDRTAVAGKENSAADSVRNGFLLYARLWYDDGGGCDRDNPDSIDLFPDAETVCGRNDRICKGIALKGREE